MFSNMILLIPLLMGVVSFSHSILNEQLWTALAKWIRMALEGKETKFHVSQYLSKQKNTEETIFVSFSMQQPQTVTI